MSKTVEQKKTETLTFKNSWSEVTLREFINIGRIQGDEKYNDLRLLQRLKIIEILTDVDFDYIKKIPASNLGPIFEATSFIDKTPPKVNIKKKKPFKIDGVEYMFNPDFKNMSAGEMISVEQLIMDANKKGENSTPGILAILIRPTEVVPDEKGGMKTVIQEFDSASWAERKEMFLDKLTVEKFYHELAFFLDIDNGSAITTLLSSNEQKKSQKKTEPKK